MKNRWREDILIGSLFFILYLAIGSYMAVVRHYIPYDALGRLVSAWLVLNGTEVKLASIGFVWPPIPTLLAIPFTLLPALVNNWIAVVILSAVCMALAVVVVNHMAAFLEIPSGWRHATAILFGINPLMVIFGANGMSEAILVLFTLLAVYFMLRNWKLDSNTSLIFSAFFFGLLPLVRYEFALITLWGGLLIATLCWRRLNRFTPETFRDFMEGRLIAYSSMAIYPIFLWSLASWFIMGSPFYFLVNDRSAVSLAEMQTSSMTTLLVNPVFSFNLVSGVWPAIFWVGLAGLAGIVYYGFKKKSLFLFGLGGLWLIIPVLQFFLLNWQATVPLLRYFIMSVPLGLVLALTTVSLGLGTLKNNRRGSQLLLAGFLLLFILSNYGSYHQLMVYPYQNIEAESWKAITTNKEIDNEHFNDSYMVGQVLAANIPPGSRVLIDTYQFGFAILLGAKDHDLFMDFTDPDYDAALKDPPGYVDYLIIPSPKQRGSLYAINREHKKLFNEGATWAEQVDILPKSSLEWKLFKVKR